MAKKKPGSMEKKKRGNPRITEFGVTTRFKPGESGNPGGKPKTRIVAEMLCAIGNEVEAKSGKTYFQIAAEALLGEAFRGDVQAFKEFADRIDGRTTQEVQLSGGLQVEHSRSDWETEWRNATHERRREMSMELDDRVLAAAKRIEAERADTPENRYRNRLAEYNIRTAAGESHEQVTSSFKSAPV